MLPRGSMGYSLMYLPKSEKRSLIAWLSEMPLLNTNVISAFFTFAELGDIFVFALTVITSPDLDILVILNFSTLTYSRLLICSHCMNEMR